MVDKKKKAIEELNNSWSGPKEEQSVDVGVQQEIEEERSHRAPKKRGRYSKGGKKQDDGILLSIGRSIFGG
jgi:hypothetical protein